MSISGGEVGPSNESSLSSSVEPHLPEGYQFLCALDREGVFDVCLAKRLRDETAVVIKSLSEPYLHDTHLKETLEREALLLAHVAHPNLARVLGLSRHGGHYALIVEYVEGISLASLLEYARAHHRRLPPRIAALIACDLLAGLAELHRVAADEPDFLAEGVHRNVTPANVRISVRGEVKLGDPSVDRARIGRSVRALEAFRLRLPYMAPEEVRGEIVLPSSDAYSVAVLLYELLAGHRYLRADSDAKLRRLAESPEPYVSPLRDPNLSLDEVLMRALSVRPDDRFLSAEHFAEALDLATQKLRGPARRRDLADLAAEAVRRRPESAAHRAARRATSAANAESESKVAARLGRPANLAILAIVLAFVLALAWIVAWFD
ncbi:MAG: serine/threonine protein kinase [Deltaproteobacteria bacterium]|nr:serine/threonine protein kinase [Deltaproteobacteria bacterium]